MVRSPQDGQKTMTQRHQWTGTSVKRVEDGEVVPACPSNIVRGTPVQVDTPEVELNVYGYSQELQQRLLSSSALLAEVLERTKLQLPSRSLQIEPPPVLSARGQLARVPQSTAANMATAATKFERLTGYSPSPTRPSPSPPTPPPPTPPPPTTTQPPPPPPTQPTRPSRSMLPKPAPVPLGGCAVPTRAASARPATARVAAGSAAWTNPLAIPKADMAREGRPLPPPLPPRSTRPTPRRPAPSPREGLSNSMRAASAHPATSGVAGGQQKAAVAEAAVALAVAAEAALVRAVNRAEAAEETLKEATRRAAAWTNPLAIGKADVARMGRPTWADVGR